MPTLSLRPHSSRKLLMGLEMVLRGAMLSMVLSGLGSVPAVPVQLVSAVPVEEEAAGGDAVEQATNIPRRVHVPRPPYVLAKAIRENRTSAARHAPSQTSPHAVRGHAPPMRC